MITLEADAIFIPDSIEALEKRVTTLETHKITGTEHLNFLGHPIG